MTVTPIGWVLIPFSLIWLIASKKWLFFLTIFFIPFSATCVMEFHGGNSSHPVLASFYFGVLWIARSLLGYPRKGVAKLFVRFNIHELLLLCFFLVCLLSLMVPIFFGGGMSVYQMDTMQMVPIGFDFNRVIHLFNLWYGVVFSIALSKLTSSEDTLITVVKVYIVALIFAFIWGVCEIVCSYMEIYFPYFLFNNTQSHVDLATGLVSRVFHSIGIVRMASVADEPSILAQNFLIGIAVLAAFTGCGSALFSKSFDRLLIVFLSAGLLLTWSSSGIIGLVALFVVLTYLFTKNKYGVPMAALFIIAIMAVGLFFYSVQDNSIFQAVITGKLDSDSGTVRSDSIFMAWLAIAQSPLFGLGWGSVSSFDLVFFLLSNTGIFGFFVFFVFVFFVAGELLSKFNSVNGRLSLIYISAFSAFMSYWFVASIAGWSLNFQHSFFVIGVSLAALRIAAYRHKSVSPNILSGDGYGRM